MRKYTFILIVIFISVATFTKGQTTSAVNGQALEALFGRLAISTDDASRLRINDSIDATVSSYVKSDSVFSHRFTKIRYLGQIESVDSRVKIITWNLLLRNEKSRYYCYFINGSGKTNSIYRLTANYNEKPVRTDTSYSESDWYGALYYNIRPFKEGNRQYWLVLGVDYGNPSVTRKVIDAIEFGGDGRVTFGRKIFTRTNELLYRVVIEYSSEAVVSLKFINDRTIVFDHLVPVSAKFRENREMYGPEFSYDGYVLEKGMWRFKENIDIRNKK